METVTFHTIDNNITFTIKSDFVNVVPNYKDVKVKELIEKHQIFKFLHNPSGPACIDHKTNNRTYFIDGKMAEGEELEKIKHREGFNGKMDQVLSDKV